MRGEFVCIIINVAPANMGNDDGSRKRTPQYRRRDDGDNEGTTRTQQESEARELSITLKRSPSVHGGGSEVLCKGKGDAYGTGNGISS